MTYTDSGTKVKHDWLPLAIANGIEWSQQRKGCTDWFDNLYCNRISLNALMWYLGALYGRVFE